MSLIMGALAGLGEAGQRMGEINQKAWNDQEWERQKIELAANREQALEKFKAELATQTREAPLKRLGEVAQGFAGQEVPVEAEKVTKLTGWEPGKDGRQTHGMQGDLEGLIAQAQKLPEEDRAPYIAQLRQQQAEQQQAADKAVEGKTRKLTGDEALNKAVEWARVNDLPAVAAYEALIGKPAREDRREERRDNMAEARIKEEAARTIIMDKKLDAQEAYNQRREERQDKYLEHQEQRLTSQGDKAEQQSQRASVAALMTSTERELERTMTLAKDPLLGDQEKAMFNGRVNALQKDLGRYRKALEGFGGDMAAKPGDEPAKPKNVWDSVSGDVISDGKVIGKAKSPEEAKALLTRQDRKEPAQAATAAPVQPEKPQFNEAGYADVQSTIDGAKRGDKNARDVLQKLIARGMTTPGQRKQIEDIFSQ